MLREALSWGTLDCRPTRTQWAEARGETREQSGPPFSPPPSLQVISAPFRLLLQQLRLLLVLVLHSPVASLWFLSYRFSTCSMTMSAGRV